MVTSLWPRLVQELGYLGKSHNKSAIYECKCGKQFKTTIDNVKRGVAKSCGCANRPPNKGQRWRGVGELSGRYWCRLFYGAKARNLALEITMEYAWQLFLEQNQKCALTGLPLCMNCRLGKEEENTASLDRIDSSKGYVLGNVQWVHKEINEMKMARTQARFIELCKLVAKHNQEAK